MLGRVSDQLLPNDGDGSLALQPGKYLMKGQLAKDEIKMYSNSVVINAVLRIRIQSGSGFLDPSDPDP